MGGKPTLEARATKVQPVAPELVIDKPVTDEVDVLHDSASLSEVRATSARRGLPFPLPQHQREGRTHGNGDDREAHQRPSAVG